MTNKINISYEHCSIEELSPAEQEVVQAAFGATSKAYAPYSGFKVGAAIRLRSGKILTAANCESEVFPSGLCAERSLLYSYATNHAEDVIELMAIASDPSERECYPCGACRQVMLDAERRQQSPIRIIMAGGGTASVVESAEVLLPFTFKL
ncbi:MAG: cytidine deaminase [Alistipes sp.]|jgi:cytidine deaminase|nr:cytidine deaminase [Alistipes sp.]MBQ5900181.1 cytidine deaminase [Alistipes sp.]